MHASRHYLLLVDLYSLNSHESFMRTRKSIQNELERHMLRQDRLHLVPSSKTDEICNNKMLYVHFAGHSHENWIISNAYLLTYGDNKKIKIILQRVLRQREVDNLFINSPLRYTHGNVGIEEEDIGWQVQWVDCSCRKLCI